MDKYNALVGKHFLLHIGRYIVGYIAEQYDFSFQFEYNMLYEFIHCKLATT